MKSEEKEVVQINQKYHILHRKSSIEKHAGEEEKNQASTVEKERLNIEIDTLRRISKKREDDLSLLT